jgi:hypothetical protein
MNKRSAIALAGGTAAALVSGVAGYSLSLTQATAQATTAPDKPIVRTEVRTITIHKKPKVHPSKGGGSSAPVTIVVHRSGSGPSYSQPPTHHTGGSASHHGDDESDGEGHGGGGDD